MPYISILILAICGTPLTHAAVSSRLGFTKSNFSFGIIAVNDANGEAFIEQFNASINGTWILAQYALQEYLSNPIIVQSLTPERDNFFLWSTERQNAVRYLINMGNGTDCYDCLLELKTTFHLTNNAIVAVAKQRSYLFFYKAIYFVATTLGSAILHMNSRKIYSFIRNRWD
ncbi:MAG: hypothetical protein V4534_03310 [Myxococcota bacterium]